MTGVMASRILLANLDIAFGVRPALWVVVAGLALALVSLVRLRARRDAPAPRRATAGAR